MKAYEQVLQSIENQILSGQLRVGSPLPAERDLAQDLGVSRAAVREALRCLDAQGLLSSKVGAGPDSGTYITAEHSQTLGKLLQMYVALELFAVDHVVEARVMLERHSVILAARHADSAAVAQIGELLEHMESPEMELDAFNKLDTAYHVLIAKLTNNHLITVFTTAIREALAVPIRQASLQMDDWQSFRRQLIDQHRAVYEAITRADEDQAADLIEDHIRTAYAILPMKK